MAPNFFTMVPNAKATDEWELKEETTEAQKMKVVASFTLWNFIHEKYGLRGRTQFRKHEAPICWGKQVAAGQTENDIFPIEGLPYPTLYTNVGQVRRYFIGTQCRYISGVF